MLKDLLSIAFGLLVFAVLCWIFVRITRRVRKGGAKGATMTMLRSMYDVQGSEGKRAIETIVELKAGKKLEEQESGEGGDEPDAE
jgi:hypothetical protein